MIGWGFMNKNTDSHRVDAMTLQIFSLGQEINNELILIFSTVLFSVLTKHITAKFSQFKTNLKYLVWYGAKLKRQISFYVFHDFECYT